MVSNSITFGSVGKYVLIIRILLFTECIIAVFEGV